MDHLWYKDAIIYETHVRAFYDSSTNGNGDFQGLTYKLDYLQDLGINCLWLLPFYPSPLRDDGYDIADYKSINPMYGTFADFRAFIREAHRRGIRVITELVINHTSDQHRWFQAARKAKNGSSRRNYYVWSDTDQKYKQARIIFTDSEKSNWSWDPEAAAYYWHRFFYHQPDLNYDNPAVLRDIIKVLRFWLDQGVDGLRLDAVPYLKEAEGTNCENIPETHSILKEIRRQVDLQYSDRMLLAEANQWPEDVRPYFGEADECHMAFHFPLMPRMFMALRQEDRHPITDIMRLTPEIPESCQWGLFLRNHDELTLEMVTDEERDYMYNAYAADPRMRINIGIRRRLAPLMDNSRRRIELLNSLLFSFKGTPIIYYGDEIGMGDNIYLGDRNGVRTPMQWSSDRNAGFSKADFAKLYSPPILDPVYGYQAINVEAQQRDPSSLLMWMKRLISLRKNFPVFGRGSIEFLLPKNRKILAYIRKYEQDTILCVANLSRFVQPFDLDLSRFEGLTPVEMIGRTEFPPIGRSPYFLTIAPHSFYWFQLQRVPETLSIRVVPSQEAEQELPTVEIAGTWDRFQARPLPQDHKTGVLTTFLARQRWFGAKAANIKSTVIQDRIFLETARPLSYIAVIEIETDDRKQLYSVPVSVRSKLRPVDYENTVARIKSTTEEALLVEGLSDNVLCEALLFAVRHNQKIESRAGVLQAHSAPALAERLKSLKKPISIARVTGEQSNTSIIFGGQIILKYFRQLQAGPNPDFEILKFLNEQTTFDRLPQYLGHMEYESSDSQTYTIGLLETVIENQGNAWNHTLEEVSRYYERAVSLEHVTAEMQFQYRSVADLLDRQIAPEVADLIGLYLKEANTLGRRTAELHLALSSSNANPDFVVEDFQRTHVEEMKTGFTAHAERVLDALQKNVDRLPDWQQQAALLILDHKTRLLERFKSLRDDGRYGKRIRIHGDYHLGQVLWVKNDFVIIDFEGEPSRTIPERRSKQSALKDVAGMIRSYSYVAYAELVTFSAKGLAVADSVELWARLWQSTTSSVFLQSYLKTAAGAAYLPENQSDLVELLQCLLLDKALYELHYELNHRPDWIRIPLAGILDLITDY